MPVLLSSAHVHCTNWHSIVYSMLLYCSVQSHYPMTVTCILKKNISRNCIIMAGYNEGLIGEMKKKL